MKWASEEASVRTLREHRRGRLLTLDALAEQAGVSPLTLIRAEKGQQRPRLETIAKVSKALGVQPTEVAEFSAVVREEWER